MGLLGSSEAVDEVSVDELERSPTSLSSDPSMSAPSNLLCVLDMGSAYKSRQSWVVRAA